MRFRSFYKIPSILFLAVSVFTISACELAENYTKIDRSGDMTKADYRTGLDGKPASSDMFADEDRMVGNRPTMMPLDSHSERTSNISGNIPVISISVNRLVPVRDILFDLAERADFDLILDPSIEGSIIYTAKSKPFDQVIAEISDLAGLKYEFNGRNLRIEIDRPYMKRYRVPYLNMTRGFESSVTASVSVGEGDSSNGSAYNLSSSSETDFWLSLTADIAQIMDLSEEFQAVLRTEEDPEIEVIQISASDLPGNQQSETSSETAEGLDEASAPDAATTEASGGVDAPAEIAEEDTSTTEGDEESASFIVNRQAGLVSVFGTEKQHKMVNEYLNDIKRSVGTQILIEAKILEVELLDEYTAGINWSTLFKEGLGITNLSLTAPSPALIPPQTSTFTLAIDGADIDATVSALNRFGTVRALASPRLSVMNNQSAALNVARNQVFFTIDIDEERDEDGNVTNREISSEIQTVPVGVVINVMPMADPDTNEIMMSVRPSVTRVDDTVDDPAVAFLGVPGVRSEVPIVDIREIDTMVKMRSGEVVVIGGLMQDRSVSDQEGIPVASDVPILGSLFRNQGDKVQKYELVVLLRAVVLDGRSNVHPTDKYLYKNFGSDRRPFRM